MSIFSNQDDLDLVEEAFLAGIVMSLMELETQVTEDRPFYHTSPFGAERQTFRYHFIRNLESRKVQPPAKILDNSLGFEQQRDVIYGGNVMHADYLLSCNMTKHRDLLLGGFFQWFGSQQSTGNLEYWISLNMSKIHTDCYSPDQGVIRAHAEHGRWSV